MKVADQSELPKTERADEDTHKMITPEEQAIQNFNPQRVPPDLLLAKLHQKARRVAKPMQLAVVHDVRVCPCCGAQIDNKVVSVCCSDEELGFLGSGIPLYFQFMKFGILFLTIIILIAGIQAMLKNSDGENCSAQDKVANAECKRNYQNVYSTSNSSDQGVDQTYAGVNLVTSLALMLACIVYRKRQNALIVEIDVDNITAGDFTLMFSNLPIGMVEDELKKYIGKHIGVHTIDQIRNVVMAYKIDDFVTSQRSIVRLHGEKAQAEAIEPQTEEIKSRINEIQRQIKACEESLEKYKSSMKEFQSCGVSFVQFEKDETVEDCENRFRMSEITRFFYQVCSCDLEKAIGGKIPKVSRAPEPTDIYWENLAVPYFDQFVKRFQTGLFSIFVIGASFGLIYGMTIGQTKFKESQKQGLQVQIVSAFMGILIVIINNILQFIIRKFAAYEKHQTYTGYLTSVAQKLGIAQFLNTAIIQLIVIRIQFGNQFMKTGGLNQNMIWIAIANGAIPLIMDVFDPMYFYRLYNRSKIEKDGSKCTKTQMEANQIFEGKPFDVANNYATTLKTLFLCSFYAYQLPLLPVIGGIGLIAQYCITKVLLIKRQHVPFNISSELSQEMTDFFLEGIIFIHSLGCFLFENYNYGSNTVTAYIQLVITILYYILPIQNIFSCCIEVEREFTREGYSEVCYYLPSDYNRANPVTSAEATEKWMEKMALMQGVSEEHKAKLQQQKLNQNNQGMYGGLMNYVQNKATVSEINNRFQYGLGNQIMNFTNRNNGYNQQAAQMPHYYANMNQNAFNRNFIQNPQFVQQQINRQTTQRPKFAGYAPINQNNSQLNGGFQNAPNQFGNFGYAKVNNPLQQPNNNSNNSYYLATNPSPTKPLQNPVQQQQFASNNFMYPTNANSSSNIPLQANPPFRPPVLNPLQNPIQNPVQNPLQNPLGVQMNNSNMNINQNNNLYVSQQQQQPPHQMNNPLAGQGYEMVNQNVNRSQVRPQDQQQWYSNQ